MRRISLTLAALAASAGLALAEGDAPAKIDAPAPGSVSTKDGLAAFTRIFEVVSHPRCANCHVGEDHRPMWSGPSYGQTRPHGMNVIAGESRMGIETIPCETCHRRNEDFAADPHAPPHAGLDWRLPPVEFQWFGKSPADICAQLSDPERTGGRDWLALAEHLVEDAGHRGFVLWGWNPGGTREPAPHDLQTHVDDILAWGAAGTPCPAE
ncbi:hypothetical protein ACW9UR_03755 [Halovulum sp. GXIMD14794]